MTEVPLIYVADVHFLGECILSLEVFELLFVPKEGKENLSANQIKSIIFEIPDLVLTANTSTVLLHARVGNQHILLIFTVQES